MNNINTYRVGKVKDAHGIRGELYVLLFAEESFWLEDLDFFYLVSPNSEEKIKLDIQSARPHKQGLIISSSEIKDRTQAEKLKSYFFEIPEELLVSESGESIYLKEILNFKVLDQDKEIGLVTDFSFNGAQDILLISDDQYIYEVPFVEEFVSSIDYNQMKIQMQIPEGLLEICRQKK